MVKSNGETKDKKGQEAYPRCTYKQPLTFRGKLQTVSFRDCKLTPRSQTNDVSIDIFSFLFGGLFFRFKPLLIGETFNPVEKILVKLDHFLKWGANIKTSLKPKPRLVFGM